MTVLIRHAALILALTLVAASVAAQAPDEIIPLTSEASASGHQPLVLLGHEDGVTAVAFSPDGKSLVSVGRDQKIRVWEAGTGEQRFVIEHTHALFQVIFSPDSQRLVARSRDGVNVWDASAGNLLFNLGKSGSPAISSSVSWLKSSIGKRKST